MKGKTIFIALCAIAIGKSIIQPDQPLPEDTPESKIKQLLENGSIKEADSGSVATLNGAVTKDGRVVELKALGAAALKKLAVDLEIPDAAQMKKEQLVEAILAVEFSVEDEDTDEDENKE